MTRSRQEDFERSPYKALQIGLAPELQGLQKHEIEALVEEHFDGLTAEEVENFARALRSFGKSAMPVVKQALPGIIQGAATGASTGMVAGPWGAVIGGIAGATAGGISSASQNRGGATGQPSPSGPGRAGRTPHPVRPPRQPQRAPHSAMSRAPAAPSAPPPFMPSTPAGQGRPGAVNQDEIVAATARLLLLLARPEVQSALLALLMGNAGRRSVRSGRRQMPVEAVTAHLAQASADLASLAQAHTPRVEE